MVQDIEATIITGVILAIAFTAAGFLGTFIVTIMKLANLDNILLYFEDGGYQGLYICNIILWPFIILFVVIAIILTEDSLKEAGMFYTIGGLILLTYNIIGAYIIYYPVTTISGYDYNLEFGITMKLLNTSDIAVVIDKKYDYVIEGKSYQDIEFKALYLTSILLVPGSVIMTIVGICLFLRVCR